MIRRRFFRRSRGDIHLRFHHRRTRLRSRRHHDGLPRRHRPHSAGKERATHRSLLQIAIVRAAEPLRLLVSWHHATSKWECHDQHFDRTTQSTLFTPKAHFPHSTRFNDSFRSFPAIVIVTLFPDWQRKSEDRPPAILASSLFRIHDRYFAAANRFATSGQFTTFQNAVI